MDCKNNKKKLALQRGILANVHEVNETLPRKNKYC